MIWLSVRSQRPVFFLAASLVAQISTAQPALPDSSREDAIRRVTAITDDFFAESFARSPAQYPAAARHGELGDNSLAALAAWQQKEDRWLEALKQIDPKGFAGSP